MPLCLIRKGAAQSLKSFTSVVEVSIQVDTLRTQAVIKVLNHIVDTALDHALRQVDDSVLKHGRNESILVILLALGLRPLKQSCPNIGFQFIEGIKLTDILDKFIVNLRQLLDLDGS